MKKKVPRKNISEILNDIRDPEREARGLPPAGKKLFFGRGISLSPFSRRSREEFLTDPKKFLVLKKTSVFCVSALLAVFLFSGLDFYVFQKLMSSEAKEVVKNFQSAIRDLTEFKTDKAMAPLSSNSGKLAGLRRIMESHKFSFLLDILGNLVPDFDGLGPLMENFAGFNDSALQISRDFDFVSSHAFSFLNTNSESAPAASGLADSLKKLKEEINSLRFKAETIRNQVASLSGLHPRAAELNRWLTDEYLGHNRYFYLLEESLNAFLGIFASEKDSQILLFFQNPAEMRPAGGFLGSYAAISLGQGRLKEIKVMDIYDPDGQLEEKIVPPRILQLITSRWGARDANWFFDFPISASKTIGLLESSKIYRDEGVKFEGAIALNFRVIESLLDILGPVELKEYNLTISKDNFLFIVQEQVEAGPDKAAGEPKRILKVLAPKILEKLRNLSSEQKEKILSALRHHLSQKDIMIFAKDLRIQDLISLLGFGGEIHDLPDNFWGSYLAVVNSNIAGGKSDAFVNQDIDMKISLDLSGRIYEKIKIIRSHFGDDSPDFWLWKSPNKNFMKVLVSPEAKLIFADGGTEKKIKEPIDYEKAGYRIDGDIAEMEKNQKFLENFDIWEGREFGKASFSTWLVTESGESRALELEFERASGRPELVARDSVFQFVFDKQSGVLGGIKIMFEAPPGYKWKESDSVFYLYQNQEPGKKIVVNLTLQEVK